MKRIIVVVLFTIAALVFFKTLPEKEKATKSPVLEKLTIPPPPRPPVLADEMLADYASADTNGKEDLETLARFLDSVFLLVKSRDSSEYSTNEDLVLFLKGANSHQNAFLNSDSPALNEKAQLIDRWGTKIIVHPLSRKQLELRSAGPDQKPYTEDDLVWPQS